MSHKRLRHMWRSCALCMCVSPQRKWLRADLLHTEMELPSCSVSLIPLLHGATEYLHLFWQPLFYPCFPSLLVHQFTCWAVWLLLSASPPFCLCARCVQGNKSLGFKPLNCLNIGCWGSDWAMLWPGNYQDCNSVLLCFGCGNDRMVGLQHVGMLLCFLFPNLFCWSLYVYACIVDGMNGYMCVWPFPI